MRGDSSEVLTTVKSQMARMGLNVGQSGTGAFDREFELALREFQQMRGILCDGVLGSETFAELERARYQLGDRVLRYDPVKPYAGDDVLKLQQRLAALGFYAGLIDAEYRNVTEAAVKELQKSLGAKADGVAGPQTLRGLSAIDRQQDTGNLFALEEAARVAASGTSLVGRTFVIEAATTVVDFVALPMTPAQSAKEEEITKDIARRLAGRLEAVGAGAIVVSGKSVEVSKADQLGASAVITISADVNRSPQANGVSSFYFGHEKHPNVNSPIGARLASLIQSEITVRTGMRDCRTHARSWASLKRLRTPKVHVVAGYLTNPDDLQNLEDAQVRDAMAVGIAAALQRLHVKEDADPETGTLSIEAIKAYN
ncbi:peptidoglycan-binding protein [Brevibacterium sp.]|uniref:N-acetylmuramoyl-L-alanine amidase n=1 Tax=Brevibacterium sp. TaxID=1701 RepID=UPI00281263C3|nr:peptidoglycan-binding protein [Brevibacterium sp.]